MVDQVSAYFLLPNFTHFQICRDLYLPIYLRGGGEQGDAYPGLEDHIRNQEKAWKCFLVSPFISAKLPFHIY